MGDIDVWGRWNPAGVGALVRFHIHTDFDFMLAPTLDYAAHRTNVTVIPAPGERDVTLERDQIVGRIHVQPAGAGAIHVRQVESCGRQSISPVPYPHRLRPYARAHPGLRRAPD